MLHLPDFLKVLGAVFLDFGGSRPSFSVIFGGAGYPDFEDFGDCCDLGGRFGREKLVHLCLQNAASNPHLYPPRAARHARACLIPCAIAEQCDCPAFLFA